MCKYTIIILWITKYSMLSHVHSKIDLEWLNLGYSRRNFYNSFFYFTRTEEIAKVLTNWRHKFHLKTMTSVTMQTFLCMCLYKFEIYEQTFLIIRSNRTKRRRDKKQSEMYWVFGQFWGKRRIDAKIHKGPYTNYIDIRQ